METGDSTLKEGLAVKAGELSRRVAWVKRNALVCVKRPKKGSALRQRRRE